MAVIVDFFVRLGMDFIALDVETANPDFSSICQIGLVEFKNGAPVETWKPFVDPEDYFDELNISIHGITEAQVKGAANFKAIFFELHERIKGRIVVTHTHFDRVSIHRACEKYAVEFPKCIWLDSARVARRTWSEVAYKGYALKNLAEINGISFVHHDPAEDARAAGLVLIEAIKQTGLGIEDWIVRVESPINQSAGKSNARNPISEEGNPNGELYGEKVVFTGALMIPRRDAAKIASEAGCAVSDTLKNDTTILVVGNQDIKQLAGHNKSSKHRKAEELILKGKTIRIIGEADFFELVKLA